MHEMFRNWREKLGAKFPQTILSYSVVRISHLDYAFLGILGPEASPQECQKLQQKDRKGEKGKVKKIEKKPCDIAIVVTFLSNIKKFVSMPKQKCHKMRC